MLFRSTHEAGDDFAEQQLQLFRRGRRGFDEHGCFLHCAVNAIKHQRVQVGVQIGRAAKALDHGDSAAGGVFAFEVGLLDEVGIDRAVNEAQHRVISSG